MICNGKLTFLYDWCVHGCMDESEFVSCPIAVLFGLPYVRGCLRLSC